MDGATFQFQSNPIGRAISQERAEELVSTVLTRQYDEIRPPTD
jgi:hypothetical protein